MDSYDAYIVEVYFATQSSLIAANRKLAIQINRL